MSKLAPYTIVYEDKDIIVVNKSRDVLTVRTLDKATFTHNLEHYLFFHLEKEHSRPFLVHRLDFETSGLIIFAKNYDMKDKLQKAFENHEVERLYEAVILEKIPLGQSFHVEQYLEKEGSKVKVVTKDEGKLAITDLKSQNYIQIGTALNISISSGRHDQIRLAIKSLNLTLLGDKRFAHNEAKRLYLNAYSLSFPTSIGLAQNHFEIAPLWLTSAPTENK